MTDGPKYTLGNQDVDTSFVTIEPTWKGVSDDRVKDLIGELSLKSICEINKGTTLNYYIEARRFKIFVEVSAKILLSNKEVLGKIKDRTIEITKEIRDLSDKYVGKVKNLSDDEICDLLTELKRLQAECTLYGTPVAFADIYGGVTDKLLDIIRGRKNLKRPIHVYTNVLGSPFEKSLTEKAYDDIRKRDDDEKLLGEYKESQNISLQH